MIWQDEGEMGEWACACDRFNGRQAIVCAIAKEDRLQFPRMASGHRMRQWLEVFKFSVYIATPIAATVYLGIGAYPYLEKIIHKVTTNLSYVILETYQRVMLTFPCRHLILCIRQRGRRRQNPRPRLERQDWNIKKPWRGGGTEADERISKKDFETISWLNHHLHVFTSGQQKRST